MEGSVYVHVPFCASRCSYCAFHTEVSGRQRIDRYVEALLSEIRSHSSCSPRTLFFGGGTPSLLSASHWERILEAMKDAGWTGAREFTVECSPSTLTPEKARILRQGGVDRISMGVQTLVPRLLDRLGRIHSRKRVFGSWDLLRAEGFGNVSLDLMFALPGQDMEDWRSTLDEVLGLGPEHLSCYEVIYEEDTPLFRERRQGRIPENEDLAQEMYEYLLRRMAGSGYEQYEVASFARGGTAGSLPRHTCRHNVNYWTGGEYLGLGPGASGHLHGWRYRNWPDTGAWCRAVEHGYPPRDPGERLPPLAKASETAAFWIRMNRGIDLEEFGSRTGFRFETVWMEDVEDLSRRGWALLDQGRFRLTGEGMRFADAAGAQLLRSGAPGPL